MIKVIVGKKGAGKTAKLVEDMNLQAIDANKDVVCIVRGKRLETQIKPQIRLIDVNDYPIQGYKEFFSFIAGICAKDYDLTDIFVDSIRKVTGVDDNLEFTSFLNVLEPFADANNVNFTIILSEDPETVPEEIKKYC